MTKTVNGKAYQFGHGSDDAHKKDQALFSELMANHQLIQRQTQKIPNGIIAETISTDTHIANIIQQHVVSMEVRYNNGKAIRSWDPMFAALFEYKDQITLTYQTIPQGIQATLTSDDPKLVELIHCHDETVHNYIEKGGSAGQQESPKPSWLEET